MSKTVLVRIAELLAAIENCKRSGNSEWLERHSDRLSYLVRCYMPSGSGIDNGTKLNDGSKPEKIIFDVSFHHMNESGMYDGWTEHRVTATPSFVHGFTIQISGKDKRQIKDYLADTYSAAFGQTVTD